MQKFQYSPPKNLPVSSEDLINDIKMVARKLKTDSLSQARYAKCGKYGPSTIKRRFKTWNTALKQADLKAAKIDYYTDVELFENILNIWQIKGTQPRQGDIDSKPSSIKSSVYKKRFGNWTAAIKNFIDYANKKEFAINKHSKIDINKKRTKREPSLRMRFKVLQRDNFVCFQCGASPAKQRGIQLHIDHIKPWSKGGETEISNLQTLCQECNLGKSDLE